MSTATVAAVDLGAASGRVMLASVSPDGVALEEVRRFDNGPVRLLDTLHWDALRLYSEVLAGLRTAVARHPDLASVGIDSWAVDYGLLDRDGALLGNPVHYRDARTDGVMETVVAKLGAEWLYATTGLQLLPFNTLFQLAAAADTPAVAAAERMLLIPDLLSYWLTGVAGTEVTNASTTQLLDVRTREWSSELVSRAGLPARLLGDLRRPGDPAGVVRDLDVPVTAVGSHDTASAVVAVPARGERFAYISCGTWSLVGVELPEPVLSEASRAANFTNEAGADGTVRYLRNVMGLWVLQESMRGWGTGDLGKLLAAAAEEPALGALVDVDDPVFLPPGDMPARIAAACAASGQPVPQSPAGFTRCIVDSLALAHRRAVRQACALSGRDVDAVHVVGGGARNALLCQLTADACGLPVVAGPVEATGLGNALVQARALGVLHGGLDDLRALLRRSQELRTYRPTRGAEAAWRAAEARVHPSR
ncbi:rhamnulokinase family protein [Phytohabitans sp. ZYX-F-186]|uniref:Rhamnulokinase family protein n=1 Tax=Phytohabitans maris TaxID=3071409 RepID=A0ABU0ZHV3_9ACTN|nr:rhamnulokinase family protein [Phytohabitans sp. ZYX-F-186]MDQ7906613.1 rhamnulokinase family protein [Phytohabitans sp. ZYX-F-186]